jgi:hypothetical protein
MIIERRPCLRCAAPHTARIADGITVCFNCRASWRGAEPRDNLTRSRPPAPPLSPYPFTPRELARLAAYRAAVAAGFYNEGVPSAVA